MGTPSTATCSYSRLAARLAHPETLAEQSAWYVAPLLDPLVRLDPWAAAARSLWSSVGQGLVLEVEWVQGLVPVPVPVLVLVQGLVRVSDLQQEQLIHPRSSPSSGPRREKAEAAAHRRFCRL